MRAPAIGAVADFQGYVVDGVMGQFLLGLLHEVGMDVHAIDLAAGARQQRGDIGAAGADFQYAVVGLEVQGLQ